MNLGMMKRRFSVGEQQPDIYEGCVTLEFTVQEGSNKVRPITADHNNVTLHLAALIIDGVVITPTKNYQHTFSEGRHKIGWKFNTTIIYSGVLAPTSPYLSFSSDLSLVTIPSQITEIKSMAMRGNPAYRPLQGVVCHAEVPPVAVDLSIAMWYLQQSGAYLYVPAGSVEAYKVAEGWSQYASKIVAIGT